MGSYWREASNITNYSEKTTIDWSYSEEGGLIRWRKQRALDWNPQGARRRGRSKQTWKDLFRRKQENAAKL
jgi:hypothetical protein